MGASSGQPLGHAHEPFIRDLATPVQVEAFNARRRALEQRVADFGELKIERTEMRFAEARGHDGRGQTRWEFREIRESENAEMRSEGGAGAEEGRDREQTQLVGVGQEGDGQEQRRARAWAWAWGGRRRRLHCCWLAGLN